MGRKKEPKYQQEVEPRLEEDVFIKFKNVKLTTKQKALVDLINNNKIIIATGPAGTSKAQPLDSPVLTPEGWVTMGDLQIGDRVMSVDGTSTIVTGVFPQGKKEIWELTFSDGVKVECCSDHLWLTQTANDRNNRKHVATLNGKKLREKSPKEGSVKRTEELISSLLTSDGRLNHSIPIVQPVQFSKKELYIDPYIMGALIGDGCLKDSISFASLDMELIEEMRNLIRPEHEMSINYRERCNYGICTTTKPNQYGGKNKYKSFLLAVGLLNTYSYSKFIPDCYKFSSVEDRIALLQGLMDTDGTVDSKGTNVSFTSTSKHLVNDIKEVIQSLGGIATEHKVGKPYYTYLGERRQGRDAYTITVSMPSSINPFRLTRKKNRVVPKTKYAPKRFIISARLVGKKEAQCIAVSHDSHLYITNDYVVTHNTFCAAYAALKLFVKDDDIYRIIITKPTEIVGNTELGYTPGTLDEKLGVYMENFNDVFEDILEPSVISQMVTAKELQYKASQFVRGRTFKNSIVIVDEFQSFDIQTLMALVTRIGKSNCKVIFCGDIKQNDINKKYVAVNLFKEILKDVPGAAQFEFTDEDNMRDPMINLILANYDKLEAEGKITPNKKNA